jgi:hypothetical protein
MKGRMILVGLVFFCVSIWVSVTAKPLGNMPYRWGAYIGMVAAWMSLVSIVSDVLALGGGHLAGGSALCTVAVLAAVSSVGILRRRRFGVVAFGLVYTALILISPFTEPVRGRPFLLEIRNQPASLAEMAREIQSFPRLVSIVLAVVYLVFTFVYFKNRWALMGKMAEALPAAPGDENHRK